MASHLVRHLDSRRVRKTDGALFVQLFRAHFKVVLGAALGVFFLGVMFLAEFDGTLAEFEVQAADDGNRHRHENEEEDFSHFLHSYCGEKTCCSELCLGGWMWWWFGG